MCAPSVARAQPSGSTTAPPIRSNDYKLELFQGPVLAPIRVTGLGGAYIASAEGVEGAAVNSASPAVRDAYSYRWFDYDVSFGASILGTLSDTDFDNHGARRAGENRARVGDFFQLTFGALVQLGYWGFTGTGDLLQYTLAGRDASSPGLTLQMGRWKMLGAYGLFDGQLIVGGGFRAATLQITQRGDTTATLLTMTGIAPEVGALLMPDNVPWRIGATVRATVSGGTFGSDRTTVDAQGVRRAGDVILPSQVVLPWEVEVGLAYQIGPRPLNPPWQNPHDQEAPVRDRIEADRRARAVEYAAELARTPPDQRMHARRRQEREEDALRELEDARLDAETKRLYRVRRARYVNWPRERILLLASVLVTGPSNNAVSVEGFLDQRHELVGQSLSLTPRLGIEGEPLHDRLRARIGSYVEPSRYEDGVARQHFTFGGDVKLFPFDFWGFIGETTWKVAFYIDVAPRYTNGGLGIGTWH